jgi:hypothetical protein
VREVLKAADMLQAEGLLKHCLEAFRGGLTVHTAIEHLVWAHKHGPEEARRLAMAYVVQHIRAIQVMDPLTRNGHALLPALLPCPESSGRCSYEMFFLPVDVPLAGSALIFRIVQFFFRYAGRN